MFKEIQKVIASHVIDSNPIELILVTTYNSIRLQLCVTYISYNKGLISIYSDLSLLKLNPHGISMLGNKLTFYEPDIFTATIEFPNLDEESIILIDEEIKKVNYLLTKGFY